jgi:hypothetical protein
VVPAYENHARVGSNAETPCKSQLAGTHAPWQIPNCTICQLAMYSLTFEHVLIRDGLAKLSSSVSVRSKSSVAFQQLVYSELESSQSSALLLKRACVGGVLLA